MALKLVTQNDLKSNEQIGGCHYSRTGWAVWKMGKSGPDHCTCRPAEPPKETPHEE